MVTIEEETETRVWEGTLADGLARFAGMPREELANFRAVAGRAEIDFALSGVIEAFGGVVELRESTEGASEAHLTLPRVHVALRRDAWDLVTQMAALAITMATHNPAEVVAAITMLRTVSSSVTIMSPAETGAVAMITERQRKSIATYRDDLDVNVDRLVERGVLRDRDGRLEVSG